jgi:hypothetical protein
MPKLGCIVKWRAKLLNSNHKNSRKNSAKRLKDNTHVQMKRVEQLSTNVIPDMNIRPAFLHQELHHIQFSGFNCIVQWGAMKLQQNNQSNWNVVCVKSPNSITLEIALTVVFALTLVMAPHCATTYFNKSKLPLCAA